MFGTRSEDSIGGIVVNLTGALAMAACAIGFSWLTLFRGDRTFAEVDELRLSMVAAQDAATLVRSANERQNRLLVERRRLLESLGGIPESAPVELIFTSLSRLATDRHLEVMGQTPSERRIYPGLIEHCFLYDVRGSLPNIIRFLADVEAGEFWADVSYLVITDGGREAGADSPLRQASLTVSVFSTPLEEGVAPETER